ncbi:putative ceramidase [Nocardia nova SH22a]|uniref:Neutral ceramidase n=1 Tax=Nocardia nova SH22a TaxID=1415166 RepID=W5TM12_9NOCA|nr:neutral/alkaline ceramidase [Nocardia nova]AHH20013.1 putative ceramidase [Nocardia nova SH22a]
MTADSASVRSADTVDRRDGGLSRRSLLNYTAVATASFAVAGGGLGRTAASADAVPDGQNFLVGCGIGDTTGAVVGPSGTTGYADPNLPATGLLMRTWARAFVIADRASGSRLVYVTVDICLVLQSVYLAVIQELAAKFGDLYTERNVNINSTHNHSSCGGTAREYAYSLPNFGFMETSHHAEVNGIVAAIVAAHERLAPGSVLLGRGTLTDASANRARVAFELNPDEDKAVFPEAIDPSVTVLRLRQGGRDVGAITWFATHGTSLTDHTSLIAGDNKGYASYRWEHEEKGVRYGEGQPEFIAAFPQTNSGDMTPNLALIPWQPTGPTEDNRLNCAIIGERQYQAARAAFDAARPMSSGSIDSVVHYIDMGNVAVDAAYTPDGRMARTSPGMLGTSFFAGKSTDNWNRVVPFVSEGMTNPLVAALGGLNGPIEQWMRDAQAPKLALAPVGFALPRPWVPDVVAIQLVRIGDLVLAAGPAEYTIVAGLRVRRLVARALGMELESVLMQGYSNGYVGYCVTPEEYAKQLYEGGHTLFGRWTAPAYMQEFDRLARAFAARVDLGRGPAPVDWTRGAQPSFRPPVPPDLPVPGHRFGDVLTPPPPTAKSGDTIAVEFVGAYPNNNFHTNGTYFEVQKSVAGDWRRDFDDNDWCTELSWSRPDNQPAASIVRIQWTVPDNSSGGRYRIRYDGDSRNAGGAVTPFVGYSPEIVIV